MLCSDWLEVGSACQEFDECVGAESERVSFAGENGLGHFQLGGQKTLEFLSLILIDNFWRNCSWSFLQQFILFLSFRILLILL